MKYRKKIKVNVDGVNLLLPVFMEHDRRVVSGGKIMRHISSNGCAATEWIKFDTVGSNVKDHKLTHLPLEEMYVVATSLMRTSSSS